MPKQKKAFSPALADRADFQNWYTLNTLEGKQGIPYSESLDYDYLSFFNNGDYRNYSGGHFPDTYKRPNHETFSNESIYSIPENPGGTWVGEQFNPNGMFNKKKKMEAGGRTKRKAQAISYDFAGNPINVPQDYNSFYNTQQSFQPLPLNVGGGQVVNQGLNTPENFRQAPSNFIGPPAMPTQESYSFNPDGSIRMNTDYLLQSLNGGVRGQDAYGTYGRNTNRKYANEGMYGSRRDLNDVSIFENGGSLSPTKAKKILEDGTVNGKKLTDKQRKYFGAVSSKKDGGEVGGIKEFYNEYLNSPNYRERLLRQGYSNPNGVIKERLKNVNEARLVSGTSGSNHNRKNNTIEFDKSDIAKFNTDRASILAHEYSHPAGADGYNPNPYLNLNYNDKQEIEKRNKLSTNRLSYGPGSEEYHDAMPHEMKADLDSLRYNLKKDKIFDTGKQQFNKGYLKMAKEQYKNNGEVQRLLKNVKSDDDLIWMMNNIAMNEGQQGNTALAQNGWSNNPFQDPNQMNYGSSQAYMDWVSQGQQQPMQQPQQPQQFNYGSSADYLGYANNSQNYQMQQQSPDTQQQSQGSNYGSMAGGIQMGAEAIGGLFSGYNNLRNQVILGGSALLNGLLPDQHNIRNKSPLMADQTLAYQPQFNNMMENGGNIQSPGMVVNTSYQPGQTLDLSPEEVQKLREAGYDFQIIQ